MAQDSQTQEHMGGSQADPTSNIPPHSIMNSTRSLKNIDSSGHANAHQQQRVGSRIDRINHPTLGNALPHSAPSKISSPRPQYSLAGATGLQSHAGSYVDPKYYNYNPAYREVHQQPVWGLAKPLPRVVRPGMTKGRTNADVRAVVEDMAAEIQEPGTAEAIPQVGMIDDQRADEGMVRISKQPSNRNDGNGRGYGHQKQYRSGDGHDIGLVRSSDYSVMGRYGTPKDERDDPLNEWQSSSGDPDVSLPHGADIAEGGRTMNKLPSLPEVPSQTMSTVLSTSSTDFANTGTDVDLEAGEKFGEWPVDENDAKESLEEYEDMYNRWASIRAKFREPLAEILATMITVLIGICTDLAVQTSNDTSGSYQSTNWAWGLGTTIGIYVAGGISGGHLNPAISSTLCLYRGFPFRKAMIYIAAQLLGAFLAGLIAYGLYFDAIRAFNAQGGMIGVEGRAKTAVGLLAGGTGKAFYTQPASFASASTGFANEFVATAILSCAILALGDDSNAPPGAGMHAFIVGLLVTALSMAFGYNTGACLNPARDFGPRLATAAVGYGGKVFTARDAWWVYGAWGATISGALVGGFFYDVAVIVGGESPVNYPRRKKRAGQDGKDNVVS